MNRFKERRFTGFNNPPPQSGEFDVTTFRSKIIETVKSFASSEKSYLSFPPMNRTERKNVHDIAMRFNLVTNSFDVEPYRFVTIEKRNNIENTKKSEIPFIEPLELGQETINELKSFLQKNPVTVADASHYLDDEVYNDTRDMSSSIKHVPQVPPNPNVCSEIMKKRKKLPSYKYKEKVIEALEQNNVVIISGGTGCGKTTQVPQFILEDAAMNNKEVRIICTQPRRLAAISIAERVAKERGEQLADTVGYHIRLEQRTSKKTILTYCTSGVLLRMLSADPLATGVTHIILDEIHEREINTDYLLISLKQAIKRRNDLKIVLMSATIEGNMNLFETYFNESSVNVLRMESRLFEVKRFFLSDVIALTGHIPEKSPFVYFTPSVGTSDRFSSMGVCKPKDEARTSLSDDVDSCDVINSEKTQTTNCNTEWVSGNYKTNDGDIIPEHTMKQFLNVIGESEIRPLVSNVTTSTPKISTRPQKNFSSKSMEIIYRRDIANSIQKRLPYFCPSEIFKLHRCKSFKLAEKYKALTGCQFDESIDVDLVTKTIKYLADSKIDGSILVFLPGYDHITIVKELILTERRNLKNYDHIKVLCLHSQMNSAEQSEVFRSVPRNVRKVILSTNIAEASITIKDVVFVVDTGKVKELVFDHETKISHLKTTNIAKSNAEQRAGRAGRVRRGFCFRLYSEKDYEDMAESQVAEMRRAAIYDICLHARMFAPKGMRVADFLSMAPEPPSRESIEQSMEFLRKLGALYSYKESVNEDPKLTMLGKIMAQFPLDPQLSRMLLFGLALKCLAPIVNLVALLGHRDPYIITTGNDRIHMLLKREKFACNDFSDHLMYIRLVEEYVGAPNANLFCKSNYLNPSSMRMIAGLRRQVLNELVRAKLLIGKSDVMEYLSDNNYNANSDSWPIVQAAITAGCYPRIGVSNRGKTNIKTHTKDKAALHPSSVIIRHINRKNNMPPFVGQFFVYEEISKGDKRLYVRTVSVAPSISVLLFSGRIRLSLDAITDYDIMKHINNDTVMDSCYCNYTIEPWYHIRAKRLEFQLLLKLRLKFMHYFLKGLRSPSLFQSVDSSDMLKTLESVISSSSDLSTTKVYTNTMVSK